MGVFNDLKSHIVLSAHNMIMITLTLVSLSNPEMSIPELFQNLVLIVRIFTIIMINNNNTKAVF